MISLKKTGLSKWVLVLALISFHGMPGFTLTSRGEGDKLRLLDVRKIWDQAPHNAFTDLEYFRGQWFCAFREGRGHVAGGDYGKVRIISSTDGESWESRALLAREGYDLRDAKLSTTPDGRLLLNTWEYHVDDGDASRSTSRSLTWISDNGLQWDGPRQAGDTGYWLWQTAWHENTGYALGYHWGDQDKTRLFKTSNGKDYELHLDHPRPPGDRSNEHAMVFDEDSSTAWMLLRRDRSGGDSGSGALVGISHPPFTDWNWSTLPYRMGGPSLIHLPDGQLLACVRRYPAGGGSAWTELGFIQKSPVDYTPLLRLPSGGDTSYAGMVLRGDTLWISYYSSHESKTAIYLARVLVTDLEPRNIESRRELFVDDHLISKLTNIDHRLVRPVSAGTAFDFNKPWEGVFSAYPTVIKDGSIYHMYYRGLPVARHALDVEVTCHATSLDGIHWHKPEYQIFKYKEFGKNNIILADHPGCHNFAPFIDTRPGVDSSARFKAFGGSEKSGLFLFTSADGVHWSPSGDGPVFRDDFGNGWAFDSQNVGFWSESESCYILYYRRFIDGQRRIFRVTSNDLENWSEPVDTMANLDGEHLYTNQTQPYFRAPHIYIAMAKRFFPGKVAIDPELARELVADPNYRRDTADSIFMSSRSQAEYTRQFHEGFLRPGRTPMDWISRSNAAGCGVVPSSSDPMSMYVYRLTHYGQPSACLSRYEMRTDGFASLSADAAGGIVRTCPVIFSGEDLYLNFDTSAGGNIYVEVLDSDYKVIPGMSRDDCTEILGNDLDRRVSWQGNTSFANLSGTPVILRFIMRDADLYSFQFR